MKKLTLTAVAAMALLTACNNYDNPTEGDVQSVDAGDATIDMVYIAPAQFRMGATSEQEGFDAFYERPTHDVTLSKGYWIGKTEITQQQWEAVMGSNPSECKTYEGKDDATLPVMNVTWAECQQFCKKLSEMTGKKFRLPTEAEWEYAARGAGKTYNLQYSGSKYLDRVACFRTNSGGVPHPVAQYMPNELDMRDMNGNVSEWVQDNFLPYKDSLMTDPCIVTSDTLDHVARGGNFTSTTTQCRTASREGYSADFKALIIGLRVVMEQ